MTDGIPNWLQFFLPSKDMIDHDDDNGDDGDDGVANFNANAEADQRSDADSKTLAPRVFYQET